MGAHIANAKVSKKELQSDFINVEVKGWGCLIFLDNDSMAGMLMLKGAEKSGGSWENLGENVLGSEEVCGSSVCVVEDGAGAKQIVRDNIREGGNRGWCCWESGWDGGIVGR